MKKTILFCAYRDWAVAVYQNVVSKYQLEYDIYLVESPIELAQILRDGLKPETIICVGWSWFIPISIVKEFQVIGVHPSDLPEYAGGSPIQHQISDGLITTKNTLFRLNEIMDSGPILCQVNLSLAGDLNQVHNNLTITSTELITFYLSENYSEGHFRLNIPQNIKKRLTEKDGELDKAKLLVKTTLDLYNFMRCRESPYPNAFIEDEFGKLYFEKVRYVPKKEV